MGLYELVMVDDQVRQMIHADESELEIERYVHKDAKSLMQSGLEKVLSGETSLEEVLRVTQN